MNFECRYKLPASQPDLQWWFHSSACNPECRTVINNKSGQTNFAQPLPSWLRSTKSKHKPNITSLERKGITHRKNPTKGCPPTHSPYPKYTSQQKAVFPRACTFEQVLLLCGLARCKAATRRAHSITGNLPSCAWQGDAKGLSSPAQDHGTDTWKCLWQPGEIALFFFFLAEEDLQCRLTNYSFIYSFALWDPDGGSGLLRGTRCEDMQGREQLAPQRACNLHNRQEPRVEGSWAGRIQ